MCTKIIYVCCISIKYPSKGSYTSWIAVKKVFSSIEKGLTMINDLLYPYIKAQYTFGSP